MPNELSEIIIKRLKKCLDISSLSLAIDRFDWTNGNNKLSQDILSNYFELFDKVIITTDDETLQDKNNRKELLEKGYSFTDITYGYDKEVIKEIIKRRIQEHNKYIKSEILHFENEFPVDKMTDEIYQSLINKTNGNISLIINILREAINQWEWKAGLIDFENLFNLASYVQIGKAKSLKKMSTPPKLYL